MQMGMMDSSGMPQQNQMGPQPGPQTPEFPQSYQQFQNRQQQQQQQEFARNQFYGPEGAFGSNGIRPEGFNQPFSPVPSPQVYISFFISILY